LVFFILKINFSKYVQSEHFDPKKQRAAYDPKTLLKAANDILSCIQFIKTNLLLLLLVLLLLVMEASPLLV